MRWRRILGSVGLACACVCIGAPSARAAAAPRWTMQLAALKIEPAPLAGKGVPQYEELFVYADVRYHGPDVLYLNPHNFRVIDTNGVLTQPVAYTGPQPLLGQEIVASAHAAGWLLFVVPTNATNLALGYQQTQNSKNLSTVLVTTPRFVPHANPLRNYGISALSALHAYLLDEALVAGYIRLNVDAPDTGTGTGTDSSAVTMPPSARAYLQRGHAALSRDHSAFDRVAVAGADARRLKTQADAAFSALENDLATAVAAAATTRHATETDWLPWRSAFARHDRALADLYQIWPGLVWPVQLPAQ